MDPTPANRHESGGDTFAQLSFDVKTNDRLIALRSSEGWLDTIRLTSGRICAIKAPATPLCEHHFLAYFPSCQGSADSAEKLEMIQIVMRLAQHKAQQIFGNPEAYTIIHNGLATVSHPDTHFHIFILPNQAAKAEVYGKLFEKNCN